MRGAGVCHVTQEKPLSSEATDATNDDVDEDVDDDVDDGAGAGGEEEGGVPKPRVPNELLPHTSMTLSTHASDDIIIVVVAAAPAAASPAEAAAAVVLSDADAEVGIRSFSITRKGTAAM